MKTTNRSVSLSIAMQRQNNNYDLLRLIAAIFVIIGHSYAISPKEGWSDLLLQLVHFTYSGGAAVIVFFFLSGLFVTSSIQDNPNVIRFVIHRVFRIFPALIVAVFICAFIIGPFFTVLNLKDYFTNPETISYFYRNILLTNLQWKLPGVFLTSNYGVNGSLWTLPLEIRLYFAIALLSVFQLLKNKQIAVLSLGLLLLTAIFNKNFFRLFTQDPDAYYVFGAFIIGAISSFYKQKIIISFNGIVILGGLLLLFWNISFLKIGFFYFWLIYTLLFIFQTNKIRTFNLKGDYSYGVYIYGFPIQQSVASLFVGHTPLFNMLLSIPVALIFGIVSWHWIERPSLSLANSMTQRYSGTKN